MLQACILWYIVWIQVWSCAKSGASGCERCCGQFYGCSVCAKSPFYRTEIRRPSITDRIPWAEQEVSRNYLPKIHHVQSYSVALSGRRRHPGSIRLINSCGCVAKLPKLPGALLFKLAASSYLHLPTYLLALLFFALFVPHFCGPVPLCGQILHIHVYATNTNRVFKASTWSSFSTWSISVYGFFFCQYII